jgi:flagellar hook-associated protein 2
LQRQQISEATLLSSLKGGAGIDVGDFKITGTNGVTRAVDLDKIGDVATTVGDVIARINALEGVGVQARINDRGDGIVLIDTAGGSGKINVTNVGSGTTAADLRLAGTSVETDFGGVLKQAIDGTATAIVTIDADDKLSDVVEKINALDRGVTASILNDGARQRLSLSVGETGAANELLVDTSATSLSLQEISSGRDALLLYGSSGAGGVRISSSTNEFEDVIAGLNLTVNDGTLEPVIVSVNTSSSSLVSGVKEFVAAYNSLRETLDEATEFNEEDLTTGILFGTHEALRVESDLSRLLTSRFFGVGQFQSLAGIGLGLDDKGQLSLDEAKLAAAFEKDPAALKKLFTDEELSFAAKLDDIIEQLAGVDNSLLTSRTQSLTRTIKANNDRIEAMNARLDRHRERLLLQFYNIETTVAKLQDNLTALSALQIIPPLTSSTR